MVAAAHPKHSLRQAFAKRHEKAVTAFQTTHKKTLQAIKKNPAITLGTTTAHAIASGALSSMMLLAPGKMNAILPPPHPIKLDDLAAASDDQDHAGEKEQEALEKEQVIPKVSSTTLSTLLMQQLPSTPRALTQAEEAQIARILTDSLNIKASASLDGHRLDTSYGYMGYEQHLPRYPGDTIDQHDEYQTTGITSGTGAWSYFAPSKAAMTDEVVQMEKYYFAVQTFIAPEWSQNAYQLKDWFKFRKMVAVNPKTGDVVVGVVGDAGPAVWTGKQFGGSPEAMHALKLGGGMRKGEVILYFVDDPENTIPLGHMKLPS